MSTAERLRTARPRTAEGEPAGEAALGEFGALVAGEWRKTGDAIDVHSPYDDALVAVVHRAGPTEIEAAIAAASDAFEETRKLASWQRSEVLEAISTGIRERRDDLVRTIALEAGKPVKAAQVEVDRAVFTFGVAAEEAKRIYGEVVPLDWLPGNEGRVGYVRRVPLGPVVGITPFNFPLNLVAHKVAPALAAGNPIIVRPSSQTPVAALKLGELVMETGWPDGAFSVVPSATDVTTPLVEDERIRMLSFTGSPAVGWSLKSQAGRKRVTLELGSNSAVIVHRDADIGYAAERVAWGGFVQAGQSCIAVQRVYVHSEVYEAFMEDFLRRVGALKVGDPLDEETDVGPLIDDGAAERVTAWVEEAVEGGAEVLAGGSSEGRVWEPTVLTAVTDEMRVASQEVFGPIVAVWRYSDVREAIDAVGLGDYGLQAGVFTNDLELVESVFADVEVGGIMVNEVPTFRVDHMPYGGVRQSGMGREGLRYAIEEMTELKLLAVNHRGMGGHGTVGE
jgi:acyl-CoA reductase-like NAD-dependent aldehyde dehydrogenase